MTTITITGSPVVSPVLTVTPAVLTVYDILRDAMGLINAVEIDEAPAASDMNIALRAANTMLGRWSSQNLLLRSDTTFQFTTTPGKASYTIGVGGADISSLKVTRVNSGYVTDGGIDYPLDVLTHEMYNNFGDKTLSRARPVYVAYDPGVAQQSVQKGTVYLYHTPDRAYVVTIEAGVYLTEFVNFTDPVTFEPAYYEAIIYNLAVRLFHRYNDARIPIPQSIVAIASESVKNLRTLNSERTPAAMDIPFRGGTYDILTDGSK